MIRVYAYLAALAVVIGAMLYIDHRGYERGKMACQAERTEAVNKTQKAIDLRDQRTATNNSSYLNDLWARLPPIQAKADEAAERIVKVYVDRVVPSGTDLCSRPDSVQAELDAARERANGTGTALQARPSSSGSASAAPAHAG